VTEVVVEAEVTPEIVAEAGRAPGGWRRWRGPAVVIGIIVLGGIIVGLIQPTGGTNGYLDPGDARPDGAHALAQLAGQRGATVTRVSSAAAARAATADTTTAGRPVTLLVTNPELLTVSQLKTLAQAPGNRIVVAPDAAVLAILAPRVTETGTPPVQTQTPGCALPAARLAGSVQAGGLALRTTAAGAFRCYPGPNQPSLVRYTAGGRTITVLGTGVPLTNEYLAAQGNAALALNLLGPARIIWLVPSLPPPGSIGAGGRASFASVVPFGAYLVLLQLFIAAGLAALWRGRRLGPVVAERLPVVVRAAETVEGHGRLYQARAARDQAAAALRQAARDRIVRLLGLPATASDTSVAAQVAGRTGRTADEIMNLLAGPAPASDPALTALADDLDTLEAEVRSR
jgi:hypothetical protein